MKEKAITALETWLARVTAAGTDATPDELAALPGVANTLLKHYQFSEHQDSYTVQELAELWGVSVKTIYRLTKRANAHERLASFKAGHSLRIPAAEVAAYKQRFAVIPPAYTPMPRTKPRSGKGKDTFVYVEGMKVV
jgi:excisionase family DNA binding protein